MKKLMSLVLSIVICILSLCPVKANNQIEKTENKIYVEYTIRL